MVLKRIKAKPRFNENHRHPQIPLKKNIDYPLI